MAKLDSKKTLVIGGSRGIGAAIVKRLAADGAAVTFTYAGSKDAAAALASATGSRAVQSDASKREAVSATVGEAGPLDILVINAGTFVGGDIRELDPDQVDYMIDLNIRGPYHAASQAARTMNENGRIIIIGSVNGDSMPFPGGAAYAMTKSAMQGLARGMARDLGARGITVNVVQPGPVDTDLNPEDGPMRDMMHGFLAIKRHARPEEVAAMVAYLASDEAAYVTGAMHTIDGGFGA